MKSGRALQDTKTAIRPELQNTYQQSLREVVSTGTGHLSPAPSWNTKHCFPTEMTICYIHFFLRVKNYFLSQQKQMLVDQCNQIMEMSRIIEWFGLDGILQMI